MDFFKEFSKNTQIPHFMITFPVGVELFYTDGRRSRETDRRTGMMKLTGAYRNFAKAPKNHIRQHIAYTGLV